MLGGKKVPSATTILNVLNKPALIPWASRMATDHVREHWEPNTLYTKGQIEATLEEAQRAFAATREGAADFGSTVHNIIEAYIGGQDVRVQEDFQVIFDNFIQETKGYHWLAAEAVVLNKELGYGGTADALALVDDTVTLVDIKTSSGVWPEMSIQLALYRYAQPEQEDIRKLWGKIKRCVILHLDKERLTWQTVERETEHLKPLLDPLMQLYRWQQSV